MYIYIYIYIYSTFYSSSIPNRLGYFTARLSHVLAMEYTVSSVLVPKNSAKVFGLHIFLLALAGVDCVSLRSLKTIFGLCGRWSSGVESISLAGVTKGVWFSCVLSCSGVIGSAGMLVLVGLLVECSRSAKRS